MSSSNVITWVIALYSPWVFEPNSTVTHFKQHFQCCQAFCHPHLFWKKVTCHLANCLHKFISMSNSRTHTFFQHTLIPPAFAAAPSKHLPPPTGEGKKFTNCWHLSVSFVRSPHKIAIITAVPLSLCLHSFISVRMEPDAQLK